MVAMMVGNKGRGGSEGGGEGDGDKGSSEEKIIKSTSKMLPIVILLYNGSICR